MTAQTKKVATSSFKEELELVVQPVKISKHADQRIQARNIQIQPEEWQLLEKKMAEAKKMGINDSLVLMKNAALIVSTKNHAVITAMERKEASSQIFTNINGTIVID
nr:TIGR02530 family flagellar biosynthesis protein [Priestia koreensis]